MKPQKLVKDKYTVEIGYSDEAKEKKLMKFITKGGDEFEITAEELSTMLIGGVNSNTLEATFVESDRINVVEVARQLKCVADRDIKKGEEIRLDYVHPLPIEYALIEQVYGIAKINMDVPALVLTHEYIESVKAKIKPEMEEFTKKFYKSFKQINIK